MSMPIKRRETLVSVAHLEAGHPLAAALKGIDKLTVPEIVDRMQKASDAGKADLVQAYLAMMSQAQRPQRSKPSVAVRPEEPNDNLLTKKFNAEFDKRVIGQKHAKQQLARLINSLGEESPDAAPRCLVLVGPPGTGKTMIAESIAHVLHGVTPELISLAGGNIKNEASFNTFLGAPPGYAGTTDQMKASQSPFSPAALRGKKKPYVILLDEVDKIGRGDPNVKKAFWDLWLPTLEGREEFRLANGETIDLRDAIIIVTSNAGNETVGAMIGDDRRAHYKDAAIADMEDAIVSRLKNFIPTDPLSPDEMASIAGLTIDSALRFGETRAKTSGDGVDIKLSAAPAVPDLLGELGMSPKFGARPLKQIVTDLIHPLAARTVAKANDEEQWELRLRPDFTASQRRELVASFRKAEPGIPGEVTAANFPVQFVCKNPAPQFHPYAGPIPSTTSIMSSGILGGRGFAVMNDGADDSLNELRLLIPGPTESEDRFRTIKLPPDLANANFSLDAVSIDKNHLFLTSVSALDDEDGTVETTAYIFDVTTGKFIAVAKPPLDLVGACVVGADGKVLVTGGRIMERDDEGFWSVQEWTENDYGEIGNPSNGQIIEASTWLYDSATDEWDMIDDGREGGRAGVTGVAHEGKIYLLGGEVTKEVPSGARISSGSDAVDIFDLETKTFIHGPNLPKPTAYAKAFVDDFGRIVLAGGLEVAMNGSIFSPSDAIFTYDPANPNAAVKVSKQVLPSAHSQLTVIPRGTGRLMGPFNDEYGVPEFKNLRTEES